ncbi:small secreted protein [Streptomyces sp. NPDC048172]|uniref:small secreted protein n=1 Tax=Streptomyces sp. NPDC048172 TaxID=3365505 RepID=UPI0037122F93
MNKKLAAALSGCAALVLALTGCSDDSGKKTDDWTKKICDDMQTQVKKIQEANTSLAKVNRGGNSPQEVKKADAAAFQKVSDAYGSLANSFKDAGAPPVDGGEKTQKDVVAELEGLSKGYADLKKQAEKLNPDKGFDKGLEGIAAKVGELGKGGAKAFDKLGKGELGKSMAGQEGCKKPTGAPSAPAS